MGGFIVDGQPYEPPLRATDAGYGGTPPDGGGLGADLKAFGTIVAGGLQRYGETLDGGGNGANLPPDPILQADEANKAFSPPGSTLFTHPIAQSVARNMGKEAADQAQRDQFLSRWAATANPVERFGVPLAAGLLDPNNLALAFVPGLGEETFLAGLGKAGITGFGARVASRAMSGATTLAAATPFQIGLDAAQKIGSGQNYEFDMRDAMRQLALNASIGALLHTGVGFAARDSRAFLLRGEPPEAGFTAPAGEDVQHEPPPASVRPSPESSAAADAIVRAPASTAKAAIDTAVAQTIDGRPVDVGPVFDAGVSLADTFPEAPPQKVAGVIETLRGMGGVKEFKGELKAVDAYRRPGLVNNKSGRSLDYAREQLAELGYFDHLYGDRATASSQSTVDDLLTLIGREMRGEKITSSSDVGAVEDQRSAVASARAKEAQERAEQELHDALAEAGSSRESDPELHDRALELMMRDGSDAETAIERAALHLDAAETTAEQKAEQENAVQGLADARGAPPARRPGGEAGAAAGGEALPRRGSPQGAQEVATAQQQIYRDGFSPGVDQTDLDETNAAVYGQERAPSARQPPPSKGAGSETRARAQAVLDERIADAERQLADAGITLTKEERAEIDQAKASVAAADQAADGYSQAGDCLTSAGV